MGWFVRCFSYIYACICHPSNTSPLSRVFLLFQDLTVILPLRQFGLDAVPRQIEHLSVYIIKIEIHSSCEIEYFVETHLCKLCVILRSRVLRVVCPH